jgi:uncharacterized protein (TIGR02594 family)
MISIPWLEVAVRELAAGVVEVPGHEHNLRILEYHGATSLKATTDEVGWCSAFVNWCLRQAWCKGTNSAMARSFAGWGVQSPVRTGAVAVFWRGNPQGPMGHVGFVLDADTDNDLLYVLGGNQRNRVSVAACRANRLIGLRWPREGVSA